MTTSISPLVSLSSTLEAFMTWEAPVLHLSLGAMRIYTGIKAVVICTDEDIGSAAPVLEDFEVRAKLLFE